MNVTYYQTNMDQLFSAGMELHQFNFIHFQCFGFICKGNNPVIESVCKWKLKKKHEKNIDSNSSSTANDDSK